MNYEEFVDAVALRTGVSPGQAEILTHATLATLAERVTGGEARDVAAQLPKALQGSLRSSDEEAEPFGLVEFVRRVSERAGVDAVLALEGVRGVFTTLRDAVTGGEFDDVMSQLPKEFLDVVQPARAVSRARIRA